MKILSRDAAVIAERGTVGHWTEERPGRRSEAERHKPEYSPPKEKTTGNGPFAGVFEQDGERFPSLCAVHGSCFCGQHFCWNVHREV